MKTSMSGCASLAAILLLLVQLCSMHVAVVVAATDDTRTNNHFCYTGESD
jgi:hypothetical protein